MCVQNDSVSPLKKILSFLMRSHTGYSLRRVSGDGKTNWFHCDVRVYEKCQIVFMLLAHNPLILVFSPLFLKYGRV